MRNRVFYFRVFENINAHNKSPAHNFCFILGYPPYNILIFNPSEAVTPQKHIRTHRLGEIYRGGNGLLAIDDEREDKQGQFAHGRECRDMDECALNIHDCALNSKSGFKHSFLKIKRGRKSPESNYYWSKMFENLLKVY